MSGGSVCVCVFLFFCPWFHPLSFICYWSSNLLHCWSNIYQSTAFSLTSSSLIPPVFKVFISLIFKSKATFVCFCSLSFSNQSRMLLFPLRTTSFVSHGFNNASFPYVSEIIDNLKMFSLWFFILDISDFVVGSGVSVPGLANFCSRSLMQKLMQYECCNCPDGTEHSCSHWNGATLSWAPEGQLDMEPWGLCSHLTIFRVLICLTSREQLVSPLVFVGLWVFPGLLIYLFTCWVIGTWNSGQWGFLCESSLSPMKSHHLYSSEYLLLKSQTFRWILQPLGFMLWSIFVQLILSSLWICLFQNVFCRCCGFSFQEISYEAYVFSPSSILSGLVFLSFYLLVQLCMSGVCCLELVLKGPCWFVPRW